MGKTLKALVFAAGLLLIGSVALPDARAQLATPFSLELKVDVGDIVGDRDAETATKTVTYKVTNRTSTDITVEIDVQPNGTPATLEVPAGDTAEGMSVHLGVALGTEIVVTASLMGTLQGFPDGYAVIEKETGRRDAVPGVAKWKGTSYWGWLGWDALDAQPVVPLVGVERCQLVEIPTRTFWLVAGPHAISVTAECDVEVEDDDPAAKQHYIRFTFDELGGAFAAGREYTGTFDLAPGNDKVGTIELTVVRNHAVWIPLVFIVLSAALALWLLTKGEGSRRNTLAVSQHVYEQAAKAAELDGKGDLYDLGPIAMAAAKSIDRDVGELAKTYARASELEGSDEYKSIREDRIKPLGKLVKAWGPSGLYGQGGHLAKALAWVVEPDVVRLLPGVARHVKALGAKSVEIKDGADGLKQVKEVAAAAKLAAIGEGIGASELTVIARLEAAEALYRTLRGSDADDKAFVSSRDEATRAWARASEQLGSAQPSRAVELLNDDVTEAEHDLREARRLLVDLRDQTVDLMDAARYGPALAEAKRVVPDESPHELAAIAKAERLETDKLLLVVIAAGVILTGLTTNYFGKTFGTPWDYAVLLVWGVAGGALAKGVDEAIWRYRASARSIIG